MQVHAATLVDRRRLERLCCYLLRPPFAQAALLARVFPLDLSRYPNCHGPLRMLDAVTDPDKIALQLHGARASASEPSPTRRLTGALLLSALHAVDAAASPAPATLHAIALARAVAHPQVAFALPRRFLELAAARAAPWPVALALVLAPRRFVSGHNLDAFSRWNFLVAWPRFATIIESTSGSNRREPP